MVVIIISGTPGTGKTTIAKKITSLIKGIYVDVNKIISRHRLDEGYDKQRNCKIIDTKKLNKVIIEKIKEAKQQQKNIIIDSHLSHYLPPNVVDLCIITKANLKDIQKRLKKRHYSLDKIRENLDAEIFDVCYNEAKEGGHTIKIINTSKPYNLGKIVKRQSNSDNFNCVIKLTMKNFI